MSGNFNLVFAIVLPQSRGFGIGKLRERVNQREFHPNEALLLRDLTELYHAHGPLPAWPP